MTNRLTVSQARKLLGVGKPAPKKKKPKYNNSSATADDLKFDSRKEARRYRELKILEQSGVIQNLQTQYAFVLADGVKFSTEPRRKPAVKYLADFVYFQDDHMVVEDVKSEATKKLAVYRLKKHLMMSVHGLEINEI